MKILLVSATSFEIAPLLSYLDTHAQKISFFEYVYEGNTIFPLVTGVGMVLTAFNMARFKESRAIDLAINLGIAGAFDHRLQNGQVVEVAKDRFGDIGVEESDGSFTDVHELELLSGDKFPFSDGWIHNKKGISTLPQVSSITVNKVHGTHSSIEAITDKYNAQIESMEGAAFFYAAKALDIDAAQIRAISNKVEARNKDSWEIDRAIKNLNDWTIEYLTNLRTEF